MLKQLETQVKAKVRTKAVIVAITTVLTFATAEISWAQTTCTVNSTNIVVPSNSTSNQGSVTANSGQIIGITVTNNGNSSGAFFIDIQPNQLFSDAISPGSTFTTSVAVSRDEMGDLIFRNEGPTELVFNVVCQTLSTTPPPPPPPPPSSPPGSQPPSAIVPRNADTAGFLIESFALADIMSFFDDVDDLYIGTDKNTTDCTPLESRLDELKRRKKKIREEIKATIKSRKELRAMFFGTPKRLRDEKTYGERFDKISRRIKTLIDKYSDLEDEIQQEEEGLSQVKCPVTESGFADTTTGIISPPSKIKPESAKCTRLKSRLEKLENQIQKHRDELAELVELRDEYRESYENVPKKLRDNKAILKKTADISEKMNAAFKKFIAATDEKRKEEELRKAKCSTTNESNNSYTPNTNKNTKTSIPEYRRYKTIKVAHAGQTSDYGGGAFALLASSASLTSLTNATISTGGTEKNPWRFFLKGKFDGLNDNRVGTDRNSNIFTIDAGAMRRINPETIIGGQVTLKDGSVKSNALRANLDATFYGASLFVRSKLDNKTYLSGTAGYSKGDNQLNLDGASGTFKTNVLTGTVRLQTNIKKGPFTLTPDAQLTVTEFKNSGFTLSNNQTALEKKLTYTDVSVGGKIVHAALPQGLGTKLHQGVRSTLGFRLVHAGRSGNPLQLSNGAFAKEIGFGARINGGINVPMDNNMQLRFSGNFALFNDVQTYSLRGRISKKF